MNENNYSYYYQNGGAPVIDISTKLSAVMKRVYVKMFLGLLVTAFVAFWAASTPAVLYFFAQNTWAMWGLLIGSVVMVIALSGAINKISSPVATALFFGYAVIMGLMLYPILLVYTGASIAKTFFITAGVFGAMSVYGYFTAKDLTKMGSFLFMALIGIIICSVVNIFLHSSTMEWIISGAGVLIFIGLTAWDTQKIKQMAMIAPEESVGKLATIGALSLYLDFINLFLYLLRFFGASRD